jgi:hypothetical protein
MLHPHQNFDSARDEIVDIVLDHYGVRKKDVRFIGSGLLGQEGHEGSCFYISFLICHSFVIRFTLPNAPRTFGGLWFGVGPEYVPVEWVFNTDQKFSSDISEFSIRRNLQLLDECLEISNGGSVGRS